MPLVFEYFHVLSFEIFEISTSVIWNFLKEFSSFSIVCEEMLRCFNEERKSMDLENVTVSNEMELYKVFSQKLTRVEKWRTILASFFYKTMLEESSDDEIFERFLKRSKEESDTLMILKYWK